MESYGRWPFQIDSLNTMPLSYPSCCMLSIVHFFVLPSIPQCKCTKVGPSHLWFHCLWFQLPKVQADDPPNESEGR